MNDRIQQARRLYTLCYVIGSVLTLGAVALLGWVAFCILVEAEPLAALSFLPALPTPVIFLVIFALLAMCIAAWQYGAKYHQEYEELMKKQVK